MHQLQASVIHVFTKFTDSPMPACLHRQCWHEQAQAFAVECLLSQMTHFKLCIITTQPTRCMVWQRNLDSYQTAL